MSNAMNRRNVFKLFSLPFIIPFFNKRDDSKVVRWSKYIGPHKSENVIDAKWARELIGDTPGEYILCNGKIHSIFRQRISNCFLRHDQPEYFTCDMPPWSGDVSLIKDTKFRNNGEVDIDYYLCLGKNAIQHI